MSYVSTVLADLPGTGSLYKFNEASGTLVDSGGGAHNSVSQAGLAYQQPGPLSDGTTNYSLGFNGTTSTISLGDIFNFGGTGSSTIEFWVNPGTNSANQYIFDNLDSVGPNDGWRVQFDVTNGSVLYYDRRAGGLNDRVQTSSISVGGWTYVVFTYDGTNQRGYLNGTLNVGPTASANSLPTPTQVLTVGGFEGPGFIGNIAFPAFYPGVVLTPTQVTNHWNAALAAPSPPVRPIMAWP